MRRPTRYLPRTLILAVVLTTLGCARAQYNVSKLPSELLAPHVENVQTVDLSRLANVAVSNQRIDRGDVLEVTMASGFDDRGPITSPVRVGEDGAANVPLIGKVVLAGLELEGAEQAITAAGIHRGLFRDPHVTVTMKRQRVNRITVIGAVNEPGVYELPRGSSGLLAALVSAGGLSEKSGTEVEIRHPPKAGVPGPPTDRVAQNGQPVPAELASYDPAAGSASQQAGGSSVRVNLVSAAQHGSGGNQLDDGDVVMVLKRDPQPINVLGLVGKPGQYELPVNQETHLLDALAMAGGRSVGWANKVYVVRRRPEGGEPAVIRTGIREAKHNAKHNLRLAPGDVVSVEQSPATVIWDVISFVRIGVGASLPFF